MGMAMPKSQRVLLAITLILFLFNIIIPIKGVTFSIEFINFISILIKITQVSFVIVFGVFTYRQIKRKVP